MKHNLSIIFSKKQGGRYRGLPNRNNPQETSTLVARFTTQGDHTRSGNSVDTVSITEVPDGGRKQ